VIAEELARDGYAPLAGGEDPASRRRPSRRA